MIKTHALTAKYVEGVGIVVTDTSTGAEIKVSYGATRDTCTCYAHTPQGFIGGWNCMPKSSEMKFRDLVAAINQGRLYSSMDELPTGRRYAKHQRQYINAAY